ncbi:DNA polymerase III subunit gamma/tau [Nitrincola tibetensis]|uniref:DNA polymerase III subunit gamma/tau n=1 Tax=Nitrincola tibetensis TaxID=2219697 RepID=A0A364NRZ7_9GAMM|nr:DNA polymerase III subunit gamma/tau [Nitrincola tibetensis]RAU19802.1 DNA polymerase III subunit gamma/tau [Nitrincola tibetensis]
MSYQVLARKWRPKQFKEMVGQEHVLKALINALDNDRLHHAYLFTGTRGVGKTSIARLFAKALNCEQGVSSEPCGVCTSCREIAEGRFVDLIEVDAASRTKVEDTRELLENVQYAPSHGRFKVYLIDEVHMLSNSSFNALLKTLEEPPEHVKFLLATTDPQKLPVTVLSRCLQFNLKNLSPQRIVEHLNYVLNQESISFDETALWLLARSAEGSMRDALSLTDQAIAFGSGVVGEADVRSMLGTIDHRLVYQLLAFIAQQDVRQVISTLQSLSQFTPDYFTLLGDLVSLLHRVALAQMLPDAIDNSLGDQQQVLELAQLMSAEDVQLFYQIGLMGRKDMPYAPDLKEGLEMVLLRMLAFRPASAAPRPIALTSQNLEAAGKVKVEAAAVNMPSPVPAPSSSAPRPSVNPQSDAVVVSSQVTPEPSASRQQEEVPPWEDVPEISSSESDVEYAAESFQKKPEPLAQDGPTSNSEDARLFVASQPLEDSVRAEGNQSVGVKEQETTPLEEDDLQPMGQSYTLAQLRPGDWVHVCTSIGLTGMTDSICRNLSLERVENDQLCFHYPPEQAALLNPTQQGRITDALAAYFGAAGLDVQFVQAAQTLETPAQYRLRKRAERQALAVKSLQDDPMVKTILQQFSAYLDESSVVPIEPNE